MKRSNGIPAAFMATISNVSPKFPNVMMEESSNANGNAKGTQVMATTPIRYNKVPVSKFFPTKSSRYNQKNCIINTNNAIKKVAMNGPIKARMMSMSNFFITESFLTIVAWQM